MDDDEPLSIELDLLATLSENLKSLISLTAFLRIACSTIRAEGRDGVRSATEHKTNPTSPVFDAMVGDFVRGHRRLCDLVSRGVLYRTHEPAR